MLSNVSKLKEIRWTMVCPWLKRVGICGFLFFLVKGILWLIVPFLLVYFGKGG